MNEWFERTGSLVGGKRDYRWTVQDYVRTYRRGLLTPSEVIDRVIDAVNKSRSGSTPLGAITRISEQWCRTAAAESTKRYAGGHQQSSARSVWEGVPILVDSGLNIMGVGTTHGAPFAVGSVMARADSVALRRMKTAG